MSLDIKDLSWSLDIFSECYNALKLDIPLHNTPLSQIKHDLKNVLVVPGRKEASRKALSEGESGKPVILTSGEEVILNGPFITACSTLAFELELDELCTAELLWSALDTTFLKGAEPVEAGTLLFFQRYQYILNILGYLATQHKLEAVLGQNSEMTLMDLLLASFKKIYALIQMQNGLVDKQRATADINNLQFVNKICFVRRQLFDLHDLLAQVLSSLVESYPEILSTYEAFTTLTKHINECIKSDEDIFLLHYLPVLIRIATSLSHFSDAQTKKFHSTFTADLNSDYAKVSSDEGVDLSKSGMRSYLRVVQLMFFVSFIPWCKQSSQRSAEFDFDKDILKQIERLIGYGTLEQLLCYSAEIMKPETKSLLEDGRVLEFRLLLQTTYISMSATQLMPQGATEIMHAAKTNDLANAVSLFDIKGFKPSQEVCDSLLAPAFHTFFCNFVHHAAVVLTQLRDNEEDFLLSSINRKEIEPISGSLNGELLCYTDDFNKSQRSEKSLSKIGDSFVHHKEIDLYELASCAELERFYMSCVYTYSCRPDLCESFWETDEQNIVGFITWGLENNTSPLITATFCSLLGSLTYGSKGASVKIWDFLIHSQDGSFKKSDYLKISVDSILNSLNYYVEALTESLESELVVFTKRQQEKQEHMYSGDSNLSRPKHSTVLLSEDSVAFISGFFLLLSTLIENTEADDQMSVAMRDAAFTRILPTVNAYLKFDNLISSAKTFVSEKRPRPVFVDDENRTVLLNLILNLLSSFAKFGDLKTNCEIWNTIDRWLCHSLLDNSNTPTPQSTETSRYAGVSLPLSSSSPAKSELAKLKASNANIGMKQAFKIAFYNVSEVSNFVRLMERLLQDQKLNDGKVVLPYPVDLGLAYRFKGQIGIWPYIEFLIAEVFGNSSDLPAAATKKSIQDFILLIINTSLKSVDWNLYEDFAPRIFTNTVLKNPFATGLSATGTETQVSYHNFVRLHHSVAILNYLFDIKACRAIFDIINQGYDANMEDARLVTRALISVDSVLSTQATFIYKLLPILLNNKPQSNELPMGYGTTMSLMVSVANVKAYEKVYYPPNLGTKGLSDFYDIILINITSVVQISLYVGSEHQDIVATALSILKKLSKAPVFMSTSNISNDKLLRGSRLLSIFEGIDESENIKYSFIQQMDSPTSALDTKLDILSFLLDRLVGAKSMTIAHFLLGFEVKGGTLLLQGTELKNGLLDGLIGLLLSIIDIGSSNSYLASVQQTIAYGPTKLTCLILKILVELCRHPLTSYATLTYLRQFDLIKAFLSSQIRVGDLTIWDTQKFNGDIEEHLKNSFVEDDLARETFLSFIECQNLILQYFSFEIHSNKSISRRDKYMGLLLNGTEFFNGTPKILEFLDIFNFQMYNLEDYKLKEFEKNYNLGALVQELCLEGHLGQLRADVLDRLNLYVSQASFTTQFNLTETPAQSRALVAVDAITEAERIKKSLTQVIFALEVKALHTRSLHSWAQLIQVLTKEGLQDKGTLILQVLQIVLPKINNDYYERDIRFAEELISLCLFLCDIYEQEASDSASANNDDHGLHRLLPLLNTCINGLLCSNSTVELRSDIYLVLNKFLQSGIRSKPMLQQVSECLLAANKKVIDVICNDCVHSEGILRITSIMCMESLVHILNLDQSQAVLQTLVRSNSLSLLTRSLKRADEIISACGDETKNKSAIPISGTATNKTVGDSNGADAHSCREESRKSGISIDTLLYELTALKTTLYLLVRIGQTKAGAAQLVQNEIFPIMRKLHFLAVDVDLGLEFYIESTDSGLNSAAIRLSLDVPLMIQNAGQAHGGKMDRNSGHSNFKSGKWASDRGAADGDHLSPSAKYDKTISYYELLVPVFQLIATILLSVGPSYRPGIKQAEELLKQYRPLVQAIMKREAIMGKLAGGDREGVRSPVAAEGNGQAGYEQVYDVDFDGLAQMAKLLTLIHSIIENGE